MQKTLNRAVHQSSIAGEGGGAARAAEARSVARGLVLRGCDGTRRTLGLGCCGHTCCGGVHAGWRRGLSARADLAAADARGRRALETLAPARQ